MPDPDNKVRLFADLAVAEPFLCLSLDVFEQLRYVYAW